MIGKQLIVTIEANGEIKIDAVGFKGAACEKASAAIEKALGTAKGKTYKPERWQAQQQAQQQGH